MKPWMSSYGTLDNYTEKKKEMQTERTPLRSGGPAPNYVFMTNPNRVYRSKIRQFQCCVCAAVLTVFVTALVVTISYSMNHDTEDNNNTVPTIAPPSQQMMTLLQQMWPLTDQPEPEWSSLDIGSSELEAALEVGQAGLAARDQLENNSPSLDINSPSYRATKAVSTSSQATKLARSGVILNLATKHLIANRAPLSGGSIGQGPLIDADWLPEEVCLDSPDEFNSCPRTPYRSADGTCNNLQHPLQWGVGMRPFRRSLPADYADGVSEPRAAADGGPLPSAREISVTVHRPLYKDDPDFTVMLAVWGQFIDHDITATALSLKSNGETISCCPNGEWTGVKLHPECFPVRLADGDPYYHMYNLTCMEFTRSAPAATCSLGAREQMNQVSSYLDGSVVYGNTPELMSSLRRHMNGQLRMLITDDGRALLPISEDPNDGCNRAEMNAKGRYCFLAGDARSNENMHLTAMHLLWARQHNAIAGRLAGLNPTWDDERLYQESRRIVAAQMEHITYNEFVPILFGQALMDHLELSPKKTGYYEGYDPTVDATIANSFAASAFRFAHTLIPSLMKVLAKGTGSAEYVEMHKILFNPYMLYQPGYLDGTLKGVTSTDTLKVDPHVTSELSQHLFESPTSNSTSAAPCGLDLVSLNIQRGRDHGLPAYPKWREYCGFQKPSSFADLSGVMDDDSIQRISAIYKSVDDIDMYTGMLSEIPIEGGILGPTVTCVLADQFVRLKKGDRYWYETSQQPQAFTPEQLDEIRKTTLAKVLCDTSDSVDKLQPEVMRSVNAANPRIPCSNLPELDLSKWQEVGGNFVEAGIARVKMAGNKVHIAPPTKMARLTAPVNPVGVPTLKTLAVGATVVGGRISTSGGTAWSGQLPLAIPVPLFDTVADSTMTSTETSDPPVFGHGILWDGTVSTDSFGFGNFQGRFSMPRYVHGNGIEDFTVKWLNGEFSFYAKLTWDSTWKIPITVSGTYSSGVYLQERPQYQYLKDPTTAPTPYSFYDVSSGFGSTPTIQSGPGVYRSPCILHGAYSADRKAFLWTGNITLIVPNAVPYDTWADAAYWAETDGVGILKRSFWLTSPKKGEVTPAPKDSKTAMSVEVTVTSGNITATSDGVRVATWWNGTFPVAIPVPIFNRVVTSAAGKTPMVFGTGVSWNASFNATGPDSTSLSGAFSLPIYVHGPGANFSIEWWTGNFSLEAQSLWNATLNGAFASGVTYTSPIFLQAAKINDTFESMVAELEMADEIDDHPTMQLLAGPSGGKGVMPKVPIVLHGNYTPDKTQFYWSGNVTFIPPMTPSSPALTASQTLEPGILKSLPLRMAVEGGKVTTPTGTLWSGQIPLTIPRPFFDSVAIPGVDTITADPPMYGHGILWTGVITTDSSGYANLEGTFSMPTYIHGPGIADFSMKWLSGDFVFYAKLLSNFTAYIPPSISGTYSSPVYLREKTDYKYLQDKVYTSSLNLFPSMDAGLSVNPAIVSDPSVSKATLILEGIYSPDKTMFIWSGNATLILPNTLPVLTKSPSLNLKQSVWMNSVTKPMSSETITKPSMAVGISVVTGSVTASSDGSSPVTWWDGTFPAALPVPLFNRVLTAAAGSGTIVFGSGVSWSGIPSASILGVSTMSGTFSVPIYTRSPGAMFSIQWWTGDFSLQFNNLWNSTLDGVILPGITYTSPIYFRESKTLNTLEEIIADYDTAKMITDDPSEHLLASGAAAGALSKIPLILHGTYSPDKTQFYWTGNVTVIPPITPPPVPTVMSVKPSVTSPVGVGKPLVVGGTVTSGHISTMAGTVWNGEVPVGIPVPLFDSVAMLGTEDMTDSTPPVYGHGILWDGTISIDSAGTASIQGQFSMPKYVHGNGLTNFSIEWLSGDFYFSSSLSWNSSATIPPAITGKYSSPLYFKNLKPTTTSKSFVSSSEGFVSTPKVTSDASVLKAPIILIGAYSLDKTMFIWSGNYSIILPSVIPTPKQYPQMQFGKTSWLGKPSSAGGVATKNKTSMAVGISVVTGSVTASSDGSSPVTWWDGTFPTALPVPLFNRILTAAAGSGTIVFGSGVSWTGNMSTSALGTSTISGTFSVPIYTRGPGANFSVDWWTGDFSVDFNNLWNLTLNDIILPGATYTSAIYFRESKTLNTLEAVLTDYNVAKVINKDPSELMDSSGAAAIGLTKVPIVLHGTYSPDKTQFYWSGNATILPPMTIPPVPAAPQQMGIKSWVSAATPGTAIGKPLVVGGTVTSGHISTMGGSLWSGELPAAIPLPLFDSVAVAGMTDTAGSVPPVFGHGILWEGTITTDSAGTASIQGQFSMPKYVHGSGLANFSIQWLSGDFYFSSNLLWNSSITIPPSISGKYSSPVYLKAKKELDSLKYFVSPLKANSLGDSSDGFIPAPMVSSDPTVLNAPLILIGAYSLDKTMFIWSGNYSIILPNAIPILPKSPNAMLQSSFKAGAMSKISMAVGINVVSGSVTASSEGSNSVTWWDGTFPVALPVPLFNRVLTAASGSGTIVFGSGVSWTGSISSTLLGSSTLSGTFSVPIYTRGPGPMFSVQWWTGDFSLQFNSLWNSTLDGAILPGVTYTSPIYFRESKTVTPIDAIVTDYQVAKLANDDPSEHLLGAGGTGVVLTKVPIILQGFYSPDKTQFYWTGNATIIPPSILPPAPVLQQAAAPNSWVPDTPIKKPLAVGGSVVGGYISTSAGSAWSGQLPLAIPVPMFDSVAVPGVVDTDTTTPPVYGHGILWDGTVSIDSFGFANFKGSFSAPKFIHGNGIANFSMEWLSGSFAFYTRLLWNSTYNVPPPISGRYSAPVYLQERPQYQHLSDPSSASMMNSFSDVSSGFSKQPDVVGGPDVYRSPLILYGAYSTDRKTFFWSGNFTVIVPNAVQVYPWPGSTYFSNPTSYLMKSLSMLKSKVNTAVTVKNSTAVSISVKSGMVSATSGDSEATTWWDGTLPVALPVPLFNRVVTAPSPSGTIVFGTGVSWSGTSSSNAEGVATISGSFSLPIYTRGPGPIFSIEWWSGNFSVQYDNLLNTTLDSVFAPGVTYSSPVYLRAGVMKNTTITSDINELDVINGNPTLEFITMVKSAAGAEPKAPIILYGTYSPDKTQFLWSGNATIIVPTPTPSLVTLKAMQKKMLSITKTSPSPAKVPKITVGATVTSGSVVAGSDTSSATAWWNGELPVAIPSSPFDGVSNLMAAPPIFSEGISWQGTLTSVSLNEFMLQGTFSFPRFIHGGISNFSIEWYKGQFSFQMSLLWNASLDGLISADGTYSSPIYLQPGGVKPIMSSIDSDQFVSPMDSTNLIRFISKSEEIISAAKRIPVVLQGNYSPDRSVFWWNGNVMISFPAPPPPELNLAKVPLKQASPTDKPKKPTKPPKTGKAIGVSVVSGSISAGLDGVNPQVWWNGEVPVTFPLEAKDATTTLPTAPVFAHGITWTGTLVNDTLGDVLWQGQFSLPSFTNIGGNYTYSTTKWMGEFSFKLHLMWAASVVDLVKPGVTYTSHVTYLNYVPKKLSMLADDITGDDVLPQPEPSVPPTEPPPVPSADEVPTTASPLLENTNVSIILHGYLPPDKSSFQWAGSAIVVFPTAPTPPI